MVTGWPVRRRHTEQTSLAQRNASTSKPGPTRAQRLSAGQASMINTLAIIGLWIAIFIAPFYIADVMRCDHSPIRRKHTE